MSDPLEGCIMRSIKKGQKSPSNGVILTNTEFNEYKKLLDIISVFKLEKKSYESVYKNYLM